MKKKLRFAIPMMLMMFMFLFAGCSNNWQSIPAGYVGKVLTPNGWQKDIREAGSIDLGSPSFGDPSNILVLLEATSTTAKESFMAAGDNGEDHRIIIGKTPITVDVYVRMMVPEDPAARNNVFAQITPAVVKGNEYVNAIDVQMIYDRFARMDVRSGIRAILSRKKSFEEINMNIDGINKELGAMVIEQFKKSGVPLTLQNVQLSNVKPDATIWQAENANAAAIAQVEQIEKVGKALRDNPGFLAFKKYETYEKISSKIGTFTIIEGAPGGVVVGGK